MASYNGKGAFVLPRALQLKNGINTETIVGVHTLDYYDSQIQILTNNSGVALDCYLPALKDGAFFFVRSVGANEIHVRDASTTYAACATGEACLVACDGSSWYLVIKA